METLAVLRDISLLFMCTLPALIVGGIGIYTLFMLRPWSKVDRLNQKYVITNLRKGVDLTQKASTTTEKIGRGTISPIVRLQSIAAGTRAFVSTLLTGEQAPASTPSQRTSGLETVRAEMRRRMAERRQNKAKQAEERESRSTEAPVGRIDPYVQQPSAPSLPRTTPGLVTTTVGNMLDTANANPMLTPNQRNEDAVEGASKEDPARPLIEPSVGFNRVDGSFTTKDATTDKPAGTTSTDTSRRQTR